MYAFIKIIGEVLCKTRKKRKNTMWGEEEKKLGRRFLGLLLIKRLHFFLQRINY